MGLRGKFLTISIFLSQVMYGSGFSIGEYNGALSDARSGGAALAKDATTIYTNPAGLTEIGNQFLISSKLFAPSVKFKDRATVDVTGQKISGGEGGEAGVFALATSIFYAKELTDTLSFGLGIHSPYGLTADYDSGWMGRYSVVKASILTLDINPSIAYKVNDNLSIGAGLSVQYFRGVLSSKIDYSAICLASLDSQSCENLSINEIQKGDGFLEVKADDISYGFNLGLLYKSSSDTRFGLSYRSKVDHDLRGKADFLNPAGVSAFNPLFTDSKVNVPIRLPARAMISAYHKLNSDLALMGDVTYSKWSRYKETRIKFDNSAQDDLVTRRDWHDTFRYALGLDYRYSPKLNYQMGIAYEESAIDGKTYDPAVPADDMLWLSLGGEYSYSDELDIAFGYTHVFFETENVKLDGSYGEKLDGEMHVDMDLVGVQLKYKF